MHRQGTPLHVLESGARVGRSANAFKITKRDGSTQSFAVNDVSSITLHAYSQISTQALRLCAQEEVPVHWVTGGGGLVASVGGANNTAQRHIRQFEALREPERCHHLSVALVRCKIECQLRFLLRATRSDRSISARIAASEIRGMLRRLSEAKTLDALRGFEGNAARAYFSVLPALLGAQVDPLLYPVSRSRRPAADRFSAALNYGYGMLYKEVVTAIQAVGLHPGFGFFHQPRSAAHALALDLMEIFRVAVVDMPLLGALNRRAFNVESDFTALGNGVSLSDSGRRKMIDLIERRLRETWKHTAVGYSLSYARIIELETRLLEKEWTDEPGLFATLRIR